MHGVEKSQAVEKNRIAMSLFLSPLTILDFDGHAKAEGLTIVTNHTREFCRVADLPVEDWTME